MSTTDLSLSGVSPSIGAELKFPHRKPSPVRKTLGVLHLINGEHFSGAERVQQLLGNQLPEFGVDPHFVCLKPNKFPEMSGLPETHVHPLPMCSRRDFSVVGDIAELAKEVKAELLHAHTPRTAMIAKLVSRKTGLPWVFHVHSPTARDSTRWGINRINDFIERWSLRSCDHIITVSKSLRREMLSRGVSRSRLTCVPNGVAIQAPIDPALRADVNHWRLGMVALIRPRKGIEVLLKGMEIVQRQTDRVTLDVVGPFENEDYKKEVMGLVSALELDSTVRFLGFRSDIPDVMRQLDGMVLPSLFGEGMPMVVLEAMAVGVPVIATRVEGTPEVLRDGREGYLAEPRDPESLAKSILRFIEDRSRWMEFSRNASTRQQSKFSDVQMARRTAGVYRKVVGL